MTEQQNPNPQADAVRMPARGKRARIPNLWGIECRWLHWGVDRTLLPASSDQYPESAWQEWRSWRGKYRSEAARDAALENLQRKRVGYIQYRATLPPPRPLAPILGNMP